MNKALIIVLILTVPPIMPGTSAFCCIKSIMPSGDGNNLDE